MTARAGQDLR